MRRYSTLFLIFTLPFLALSQGKNVPGYMGKKFSLQYQMFLWPSFNNPNSSEVVVGSDDYTDVSTSINMQHHVIGGYSLTKQIDFIADVNFAKTNFDPYNMIYQLDQSSLVYPELKATGGAVGIRVYTNHFAPLGSHLTFKLGYTKLKIDDLYYTLPGNDFTPTDTDLMISGGTKGAPTITMGFGNNRIIGNRFMINYGLDFTLFAGGIGHWKPLFANESQGEYIYFESGNTVENQEIYLKKAAARYAFNCAINLKIGIGFIL